MNLKLMLCVVPLFFFSCIGCGNSGESKVVEPAEVVSPSADEIQSEDYEKAMQNMQ